MSAPTFSDALAAAQGEMRHASLDAMNPHYRNRYATLASVIEAVRPALTRHRIAWTQCLEQRPEVGLVLVTRLLWGGSVGAESAMPLPAQPDPQKFGSLLSYHRRYDLLAICGLAADDDDDAEKAAQAPAPRESKPSRVEATIIRAEASPPVTDQENAASDAAAADDFLRRIQDTWTIGELQTLAGEMRKRALPEKYRKPLLDHWQTRKAKLGTPADPEQDGR